MTYVITDLHGMYDFYPKIKERLKPEDKVYCLGDCADRGHSGWRLLKAIIDDPQFTLIKGNHEDMLYNAVRRNYSDYRLLNQNGGRVTYFDCIDDEKSDYYLDKIKALPFVINVTVNNKNFVLSHAGFTPYKNATDSLEESELLWDRYHTHKTEKYPDEEEYDEDYIVIHGHTPIQHLINEDEEMKFEPYYYFDNQKICLDIGTYVTKKILFFCLDNMTYEVIEL